MSQLKIHRRFFTLQMNNVKEHLMCKPNVTWLFRLYFFCKNTSFISSLILPVPISCSIFTMLVDCIDRLCGGLSEEKKKLCCHFSDAFLMLQVSVTVHSIKETLTWLHTNCWCGCKTIRRVMSCTSIVPLNSLYL